MQFTDFQVQPIPADFARRVRATGTDDEGNTARFLRSSGSGEPVRDALRRVELGEEILLCAYSPFRTRSLYREVGAIFLLARAPGVTQPARGNFPPDFLRGDLVLRAYDANEEIVTAELLLRGSRPEPVIGKFFAEPVVESIHVRFAAYGCFACRIERN